MLATRTSSVGAAAVWLSVEVMAIVLRVGRVRGRWLGFDFATKAVRVSAFRFSRPESRYASPAYHPSSARGHILTPHSVYSHHAHFSCRS